MRPTISLVALSCALLSLPALARNPTAQERADIEQLAYKYVFALDWRDPEAYAAAFAPDGVLNYGGGQAVGREQIAGVIKTMRDREMARLKEGETGQGNGHGKHFISSMVIEVSEDGTRAISQATVDPGQWRRATHRRARPLCRQAGEDQWRMAVFLAPHDQRAVEGTRDISVHQSGDQSGALRRRAGRPRAVRALKMPVGGCGFRTKGSRMLRVSALRQSLLRFAQLPAALSTSVRPCVTARPGVG